MSHLLIATQSKKKSIIYGKKRRSRQKERRFSYVFDKNQSSTVSKPKSDNLIPIDLQIDHCINIRHTVPAHLIR